MHASTNIFFFFQAKDGIRDGHVTGVQTCALPISTTCSTPPTGSRRTWPPGPSMRSAGPNTASTTGTACSGRCSRRSEERRVGKECRSRQSTENSKEQIKDNNIKQQQQNKREHSNK